MFYIFLIMFFPCVTAWLDECECNQPPKVYELHESAPSPVCHAGVLNTGPAATCAMKTIQRELADFPGAFCDKSKIYVTDVGGGMSTALLWHWEPSNEGNEADTPPYDLFFHEHA